MVRGLLAAIAAGAGALCGAVTGAALASLAAIPLPEVARDPGPVVLGAALGCGVIGGAVVGVVTARSLR